MANRKLTTDVTYFGTRMETVSPSVEWVLGCKPPRCTGLEHLRTPPVGGYADILVRCIRE